jgi:hypothetical protein
MAVQDMEAHDLLGKLVEWLRDEGWTDEEIMIFIRRKLDGKKAGDA